MTEKRYSDGTLAKWYYSQTNVICDGNNEYYLRHKESVKDWEYNELLGTNDLLDELNRLSDENEQLKSKNRGLQSELQIFKEDVTHSNLQINKLADENEQLKQQIQQLQHWNKCLAEKRHQELSYKPYTASKSEKELKELLEPKLFNCSDR